MKNTIRLKTAAWLAGVSFLFAGGIASAQLAVGIAAPKLQVGQWIQGEPVNGFDTNHIYLIEFWATWCGPCREAMPHLNALAEKFKDKGVVVIGQDIWDTDDAVIPFVKKMGDQMTYRVALDDKRRQSEGFMAEHWWKRGGGHGIPCAMIVNQQGLIAWIGHPRQLKERVINDMLSGHYDLPAAVIRYSQQRELGLKQNEIAGRLYAAMKQKQWDDATAAVNELVKVNPDLEDNVAGVRIQILLGQKKYDEADQLTDSFMQQNTTGFDEQNEIAWLLVTQVEIESHSLAIAKKLAESANKIAGGKDAGTLDTLARAQFLMGDKSSATATEQKALAVAPEGQTDLYKKCLTSYQQNQLPTVTQ